MTFWLYILGLTNVAGRPYAFWSGSGSVLLPPLIQLGGIALLAWWHNRCHVTRCWRYARRTTAAGERACRRHHPEPRRTVEDIHAAHHAHLRQLFHPDRRRLPMPIPEAVATSAEGIDVSSYQVDLTVHDLSGLHFALTKASDGRLITDPNFTHNWAAIAKAGLHRGAYHELQASRSATAVQQADHFLAVVRGGGLKPGDMLAVVASDYTGVTDSEVKTFCGHVHAATEGRNPVLVYTDLDVSHHLVETAAAGYPLWVAWPSPFAPGPSQWAPARWKTWRLWQWGTRMVPGLGHVDADAFNGSPAEMDAWIATYTKPRTHLAKVTADGTKSLHDLVHAHPGNGVASVLKQTLLHSAGHDWQHHLGGYIDAGDWDAPLFTGAEIWLYMTTG